MSSHVTILMLMYELEGISIVLPDSQKLAAEILGIVNLLTMPVSYLGCIYES